MTCKKCNFFKSLKSASPVSKTGKCCAEPIEVIVSEDRPKCRYFSENENLGNDDDIIMEAERS